ncbi:hypothetical protein VNI00_011878 [Paramarasmius palmivorus]|uniref:Enoyl reductase (ER) domain-containing protein n=1 Tax=Paramarasmius palmivorus TaxID=297713 RepID=A0AAW0C8E3_9AGAR
MAVMPMMKAIVKTSGGKYRLEDVEIPRPGPGEVLVKVAASAENPADWKNMTMVPEGHIIGYDFAGTVHEIGPCLDSERELRYVGERVAGLVHGGAARNGAFAEFVVAQAGLLFHLPDNISFEEGAQMGVACMTACYSLYLSLDLPTPYDTETVPQTTLLVWSGSTSVGQIVMQLAKLSNMRVIATASPKQFDFVRSLGADEVYDYSDSFTGREIFQATGGNIHCAVDCWSEGMSPYQVSASLSNDHGKIASLLPYQSRKKGIESTFVFAYAIFGKDTVFPFPSKADTVAAQKAREFAQLTSRLLAEGKIRLGPIKVFPDGLAGVADGMEYARMGKVHGEKIVHRITDTPGLRAK